MSLKIRPVCLKSSLVVVFLLFLQFARSQPGFTDVDALLLKNQKQLGKDLVTLIYKDGKVVYTKEMGEYFNGKSQAPVAACSEWFTAAVVMTFVDEGKLSLDDPVVKYIPLFRSYMKNYVTIRNCLTHTTGIENDKGGLGKLFKKKKFATLEDEMKSIAEKEISDKPGKEFHYGEIGPTLAARVIEVISKKSFDRLAQERIFRKLKMRSTSFTNFDGAAPDPAGGAQSTANDMINFMSMLLNKGMFEDKRVLSEASVAEMLKPQFTDLPVKFTPDQTKGFHHGLGTWIQEEDAGGGSTTVSSPSLFGVWPYIDLCRKYAAVIFTKSQLKDQKKDFAQQFKEAVDAQMGGCK